MDDAFHVKLVVKLKRERTDLND